MITKKELDVFAHELNDLLRKYQLHIVRQYGPMLFLKFNKWGADYSAINYPPDEEAEKNPNGEYVISEPWGG